jgi:hypothetical protein
LFLLLLLLLKMSLGIGWPGYDMDGAVDEE